MRDRYFTYVAWRDFLLALWAGWRPPAIPVIDPRLDSYGTTMEIAQERDLQEPRKPHNDQH